MKYVFGFKLMKTFGMKTLKIRDIQNRILHVVVIHLGIQHIYEYFSIKGSISVCGSVESISYPIIISELNCVPKIFNSVC